MSSVKLRKEVHEYIDQVDDRVLKMVHALLKEYANPYTLTEEQEFLVEERRAQYKAGKAKTYSPAELRRQLEMKIARK